jgi:hypothetical protein
MNLEKMLIYVALMDEGTKCWRPVQAQRLEGDRFRIVDAMPEGERWEFPSGAVVRCREHTFAEGKGLLAVEEFP